MVGATHFNAFRAAEDKETFIDAAITAANKFNTFFGGYKDIGSIQHTGQNMSKTYLVYHGQNQSITETYRSSGKITVFHRKKMSNEAYVSSMKKQTSYLSASSSSGSDC